MGRRTGIRHDLHSSQLKLILNVLLPHPFWLTTAALHCVGLFGPQCRTAQRAGWGWKAREIYILKTFLILLFLRGSSLLPKGKKALFSYIFLYSDQFQGYQG